MPEVNVLADHQPFDLVELIEMTRVDRIAAIGFPGNDHRDRRPDGAHRTDLHGRGMRAQQQIGA